MAGAGGVERGGYESVETLRRLEGRVQVYLPDFKYALSAPAREYSAAVDYPEIAEAAILEMFRQTGPYKEENGQLKSGVLIRHLVLPGELENTKAVIDWVSGTFRPGDVLFSLMSQYTPQPGAVGKLARRLTPAEYRAASATWRTAASATGSRRSVPPPRRNTPRTSICRAFETRRNGPGDR